MPKGTKNPNPRGRKNGNGAKTKTKEQTADGAAVEFKANDRAKVIRDCAKAFRAINAQRQSLNEEAADIRERLKDCGIDVPSFQAALRISDKETEARDTFLGGLQESLDAMGLGGQLDFISAMEKVDAAEDKPDTFEEDAPKAASPSKPAFLQEPAGNA